MSDKDTQTIEDLSRVIDIIEQRIHEIECTSSPSLGYLKAILDLTYGAVAKLE